MAEETNEAQDQTADIDTEASEQEQTLPDNEVNVEDAGTLKKTVTVTIPAERIQAKRDEMFGELSSTAQVPGFRIGRAPRRLLEKRFGKEVASDVRNSLIGESIGDAIEKSELKTLGEPDLDLDAIELPEAGAMEFSFSVEVAPEFDLPELKGVAVEKTSAEVTDERLDQEIEMWAQSQSRYEDTDGEAADGDVVVAGATIRIEGEQEAHERPGLTLRVAPGQIEGLPLVDLAKALAGKKAEDSAELKITVPDAHPNEAWQGKEATVEIRISQVRRRVMPTIDDEFATGAGFDNLKELREFIRSRISAQAESEVRRNMRQQVEQYLLDKTEFDLPEGVATRHAASVIQRRTVELLQRGVPRERIEENITELQAAAGEQARRDLKLQFILDKIADEREIEVTADEVNARVAQMASMYNRRPERVRQELAADGSLAQLDVVIREEKTMDALLQDAKVTEVTGEKAEKAEKKTPEKAEKMAKKTTKKAAKKTAKKTEKKAASKPKAKTEKKAAKKAGKKTESD